MKKYWFSLCICIFTFTIAIAQKDETLFNQLNFSLTGAWGGTVVGASQIGDDFVPSTGGYGLLEFNKTLLIGWGGFDINNQVTIGAENYRYDLDYNGLMIGYAPKAFKVVHPHVMGLVGSGQTHIDDIRDNTPVIQLGGGLELNIFQWFRINANGGYRFLLDVDNVPAGVANSDLSGLYGEVKFKFGWSWGDD